MRWCFVGVVLNEYDGHQSAINVLTPSAVLDIGECFAVLVGLLGSSWLLTYFVLRKNKPKYDTSV